MVILTGARRAPRGSFACGAAFSVNIQKKNSLLSRSDGVPIPPGALFLLLTKERGERKSFKRGLTSRPSWESPRCGGGLKRKPLLLDLNPNVLSGTVRAPRFAQRWLGVDLEHFMV